MALSCLVVKGAESLRRYFETNNPENFRRVAQDAFVAGNDLLFLADFGLDDHLKTQFANLKETIQAFRVYANIRDFAAWFMMQCGASCA